MQRPLVGWTPVDFMYPDFQALGFDIRSTKPLSYRPFRWVLGARLIPHLNTVHQLGKLLNQHGYPGHAVGLVDRT